jgi:repressor LexA
MSEQLTPAQAKVMAFLEQRDGSGEGAPTLREICEELGYNSTKAAFDHLKALETKGWIKRDPKRARAIHLLHHQQGLPLLGNIAAGLPRDTDMADSHTRVPINASVFGVRHPDRAYVLRVTGDSMLGRNLIDGDLVVVEHGAAPKDDDIVAALIDNQTTLKTLVLKGGRARLKAENPAYPNPDPSWGFEIQGVVRGLLRKVSS